VNDQDAPFLLRQDRTPNGQYVLDALHLLDKTMLVHSDQADLRGQALRALGRLYWRLTGEDPNPLYETFLFSGNLTGRPSCFDLRALNDSEDETMRKPPVSGVGEDAREHEEGGRG
jgi:hypothetical protein